MHCIATLINHEFVAMVRSRPVCMRDRGRGQMLYEMVYEISGFQTNEVIILMCIIEIIYTIPGCCGH